MSFAIGRNDPVKKSGGCFGADLPCVVAAAVRWFEAIPGLLIVTGPDLARPARQFRCNVQLILPPAVHRRSDLTGDLGARYNALIGLNYERDARDFLRAGAVLPG